MNAFLNSYLLWNPCLGYIFLKKFSVETVNSKHTHYSYSRWYFLQCRHSLCCWHSWLWWFLCLLLCGFSITYFSFTYYNSRLSHTIVTIDLINLHFTTLCYCNSLNGIWLCLIELSFLWLLCSSMKH